MTTTNYSWTLPTVGASVNTWGTLVNNILIDIDAKMFASTGGTISGNVSVAGQVTSDTSNAQVQVIKGSNATGGYVYLYDSANSAGRGYIGWGSQAITGAAMADLCIAPASAGGAIRFGSVGGAGTNGMFDASGNLLPGANGTQAFGSTSLRWSQVWCTAGAFNTSDATLKTKVSKFNDAEIQAAAALSKEIGWFQWLDSVKDKGEEKARHHIGLTVQRAAEIMESHGLKPWSYGFMGYDKWAAVTEIVDATEDDDGAYQEQVTRQKTEKQASQKQTVEIVNGKPTLKVETIETDTPVTEQIQVVDADGKPVFIDVQEVPAVLDEEGNVVTPAVPAHQVPMLHAVPVMETVTVWKRVKEVRPAGESYAFRSDQLAFFIAAGVAAKVGA